MIDPDEAAEEDYLEYIEGGETAIHIHLSDDKEWWLAHNPDGEYIGELNGPWLFWYIYPTGFWELILCTREIFLHFVDELYYVDRDGKEAHSIHRIDCVPIAEAPTFVQEEVTGDA